MVWENVQSGLWLFVQGLLIIAIPVLVKALLDWIREQIALMRSRFTDEQNYRIDMIIDMAVQAAEQTGIIQELTSDAKKALAIGIVQAWLDEHGIYLNAQELADRIEAAVYQKFTVG